MWRLGSASRLIRVAPLRPTLVVEEIAKEIIEQRLLSFWTNNSRFRLFVHVTWRHSNIAPPIDLSQASYQDAKWNWKNSGKSDPYLVTRNPMYIGFFIFLAGLSAIFALSWPIITLLVVQYSQPQSDSNRGMATLYDVLRSLQTTLREASTLGLSLAIRLSRQEFGESAGAIIENIVRNFAVSVSAV